MVISHGVRLQLSYACEYCFDRLVSRYTRYWLMKKMRMICWVEICHFQRIEDQVMYNYAERRSLAMSTYDITKQKDAQTTPNNIWGREQAVKWLSRLASICCSQSARDSLWPIEWMYYVIKHLVEKKIYNVILKITYFAHVETWQAASLQKCVRCLLSN